MSLCKKKVSFTDNFFIKLYFSIYFILKNSIFLYKKILFIWYFCFLSILVSIFWNTTIAWPSTNPASLSCGINTWDYYTYNTSWFLPEPSWFCTWSTTLPGVYDDFPNVSDRIVPSERYWDLSWSCAGAPWSCVARISSIPTCWENQKTYLSSENWWINNTTWRCDGWVLSWNKPTFPFESQRDWTKTIEWQCKNWLDETTNCEAIVLSKPKCGLNRSITYQELDIDWYNESTTGFCEVWNIAVLPVFPSPTQRWQSWTNISWNCTNEWWETTGCIVYIPPINPCGPNATNHSPFHTNWIMWSNFPDPYTDFCLVWNPWRQWPIFFPSLIQRNNNEITLNRYCDINGDKSSICEAKIEPVHNAVCGPNAKRYKPEETERDFDLNTWFCEVWYLSMSNNIQNEFPTQRSQEINKYWNCLTPDNWQNVNCSAVFEPNLPACGDIIWSSILNINLIPDEEFCKIGVAFGITNLGIQNPRWWSCQTWSEDDNNLIHSVQCSAHKSCVWNWFEYYHNKEISKHKVNWKCGTANWHIFKETDPLWYTDDYFQCEKWIPNNKKFPDLDSSVFWTCLGQNGWDDSILCSSSLKSKVNWVCWEANEHNFLLSNLWYGAYKQCQTWIPSDTTFPKAWTTLSRACQWEYGWFSDICRASRDSDWEIVNWICGWADGHIFTWWNIWYDTQHNQCDSWIPVSLIKNTNWTFSYSSNIIFPNWSPHNTWYWLCEWLNGWIDSTNNKNLPEITEQDLCIAYYQNSAWIWNRRPCGVDDIWEYWTNIIPLSQNTRNLSWQCLTWNATDTNFPNSWTQISRKCLNSNWNEILNNGNSITCVARKEAGTNTEVWVCGWADGHIFNYNDVRYSTNYNQCAKWTPTLIDFPSPWQTVTWRCIWPNGWVDSPICSTTKTNQNAINWNCWLANNYTFSWNQSNYNFLNINTNLALCSAWISSMTSIFPTSGQWLTWTCLGQYGWKNSEICSSYFDPGTWLFVLNSGWITQRYDTDRPEIWKSCQDVLRTWLLTCDDGLWIMDEYWSWWIYITGKSQLAQHTFQNCDDSQNKVCIINGVEYTNGDMVSVYKNNNLNWWDSCANNSNYERFRCDMWKRTPLVNWWYYEDYKYFACIVNSPRSCVFWDQPWNQVFLNHNQIFEAFKDDIVERNKSCSLTWTDWNKAFLQCIDSQIVLYTWYGSSQLSSYIYPSCQISNAQDCEFNGNIIKHYQSVTWRNKNNLSDWWVCKSEVRTCIDGFLSGSYQYSACETTDGLCGSSSWLSFVEFPKYNLCNIWNPIIPSQTWLTQWTRQCQWNGGISPICRAEKIINTEIIFWTCKIFEQPTLYLNSNMSDICISWTVSWFVQTNTWRNWSCVGRDSSWNIANIATNCFAKNTITPYWNIIYNPTTTTDWVVIAILTGLGPIWAKITNNSWNANYIFTGNGTFIYEIDFDGKKSYLTASVDRINVRNNIFENLLKNYSDNYCSLYAGIKFEDIQANKYAVDITTMLNTCVMHGYKFGNKNLFLPEKNLTKAEALITLSRLGSAITNYYGRRLEDWREDIYKWIFINDEMAAHITRWNKIWMMQYLPSKYMTGRFIPKNTVLRWDLIISKETFVSSGSKLKAGSILAPQTKFIKSEYVLDQDPEIFSWIQFLGDVLDQELENIEPEKIWDEKNSWLVDSRTYTNDRTIDKDIMASAGTMIKSGSIVTNDVILEKSGFIIERDKPITKKEWENMITHFLWIHKIDPWLKDRLMSEIKFKNSNYITRWETANIIRKLMEPYNKIPIWNDYLLLKWVYDYIKNYTSEQMVVFLNQFQLALMKVPNQMLEKYNISKFRVLQDIDAIRKNTTPNLKPKIQTNVEELWNRRQDRYNTDAFWSDGNVRFYNSDNYDRLEF